MPGSIGSGGGVPHLDGLLAERRLLEGTAGAAGHFAVARAVAGLA